MIISFNLFYQVKLMFDDKLFYCQSYSFSSLSNKISYQFQLLLVLSSVNATPSIHDWCGSGLVCFFNCWIFVSLALIFNQYSAENNLVHLLSIGSITKKTRKACGLFEMLFFLHSCCIYVSSGRRLDQGVLLLRKVRSFFNYFLFACVIKSLKKSSTIPLSIIRIKNTMKSIFTKFSYTSQLNSNI